MRSVQSSDAEARLPALLDEVERGETIVITRHGRAIARLVPELDQRQIEVDDAIATIRRLRTRNGPVTVEDILSSIHEGHRY